jgi:hypothetical protein
MVSLMIVSNASGAFRVALNYKLTFINRYLYQYFSNILRNFKAFVLRLALKQVV